MLLGAIGFIKIELSIFSAALTASSSETKLPVVKEHSMSSSSRIVTSAEDS